MNKRLSPATATSSANAVEHAIRASAKAELRAAAQKKANDRRLQTLWQQQEEMLLIAALEGETHLLLSDTELVFPARLLDLGFSVLVTSISSATEAREQAVLARISKRSADLRARLLRETEQWVRAAVRIDEDLRPHLDRIHAAMLSFLLERCTAPVDFDSFSLMEEIDSAPHEVLSILATGYTSEMESFPETDRLERTIGDFALSLIELHSARSDFDERRNTPTVPIDRTDASLVEPPSQVSWQSSQGIQAWPDQPLIQAESFAWISGNNGQLMLKFIEDEIAKSAKAGKRSFEFNVACPFSAAPSIRLEGTRSRPFCPPASELHAVLTALKWQAEESLVDAETTRLSIAW
jgi:hypothetical protein